MGNINTVTLTGNLGAAPEIRNPKSTVVATFSLATNLAWTNGDGERRERTDWHRVVAFNGLAKTLEQLGKGDQVAVQGRLQTRHYVKDGETRTVVEVVASQVEFLRLRSRSNTAAPAAEPPAPQPEDDDIPF